MFRKIAFAMLATGVLVTSVGTSQAANPAPVMPAVQMAHDSAEANRRGGIYVQIDFGRGHGYGRGHGRGYGRDHGYGRGHGRGYSRAHYNWCAARYRSYDARTNTYQPYEGPRRQCRSPYN